MRKKGFIEIAAKVIVAFAEIPDVRGIEGQRTVIPRICPSDYVRSVS